MILQPAAAVVLALLKRERDPRGGRGRPPLVVVGRERPALAACRGFQPGFNFSVEFRRNFGVFFVFASYREVKFRYFSLFSFSNLKIQKYL